MRIALITTTINVPHVLALYRKLDADVRFFVAGDHKTPHAEVYALLTSLGNARYIDPVEQARWKCSELIGWNCIQRRNIALLEAVEWGADVIYSVDDDNIPLERTHFVDLAEGFDSYEDHNGRFDGPCIEGCAGWFDPGNLLIPPARQRGFPHSNTSASLHPWTVKPITSARVGVVAGACLGDPDVDAVTRIATHPEVHGVSELLRAGAVVDPKTWTIFNSQNTAFLRELAPVMFMLPGVGRFDDIYASLICQRFMRDHNLYVYHGKPFVWQSRNAHNLLTDLRAELDGMERVQEFARLLQTSKDMTSVFTKFFPARTGEAAQAFLEDLAGVV